MGERIFRIGECWLTEHDPDPEESNYRNPPGHWEAATCAEYCDAVNAHGGLSALRVWSGFTNMAWSDRGAPFMFTEWGTEDRPVAADGGPPEARGFGHPCLMQHAVFVLPADEREGGE